MIKHEITIYVDNSDQTIVQCACGWTGKIDSPMVLLTEITELVADHRAEVIVSQCKAFDPMADLIAFRDSLAPPRYGLPVVDTPDQEDFPVIGEIVGSERYVHGLDPAEEDPRRAMPDSPP